MTRLRNFLIAGSIFCVALGVGAYAQQHSGIRPPEVSTIPGRSAEISFELFRGSRILIPVTVNGHSTIAVLDSAASATTIDRGYARSIGLPEGIKIAGHGVGGDVEAELVSGISIDAGTLAFRKMSVGVMDLQQVARGIGHPITVILGREFFGAAVISVDWAAGRMRLSPSAGFAPPGGATLVSLGERGPFRTIPISVNDGPPIDALLDFGSSGNLSLAARDWSNMPSVAALPYAKGVGGGVGGLHGMRAVTFPSVTYGGRRFTNVPGALDDQTEVTLATRMTNAGIGFLKQFHVDIDFGHDRLYLRPRKDATPFDRDRAGTRLELTGDALKVMFVSPQGPAAGAGIKVGDEITSIDGQKVTANYYQRADWTRGPAGKRVVLTRADGTKAEVTLADYY